MKNRRGNRHKSKYNEGLIVRGIFSFSPSAVEFCFHYSRRNDYPAEFTSVEISTSPRCLDRVYSRNQTKNAEKTKHFSTTHQIPHHKIIAWSKSFRYLRCCEIIGWDWSRSWEKVVAHHGCWRCCMFLLSGYYHCWWTW